MLDSFDPVDLLASSPSLWIAVGLAAVITILLVNSRLHYLSLPKILKQPTGSAPPDCMVIIPARNEEATIARAVSSFPHDTVIVVDDHSTDGTKDAAAKAGAGVLDAPDLIEGAIGKSNACAAGARVLTSKWILFADADTWYQPGFLEAAIATAEAEGLSFASFYLRTECETWAERILVPYAMALFFCAVNPKKNRTTAFNGQCILVRRVAYEFVGGHSALLTHVVEEVRLAALAERHRMKYTSVRAANLGHARLHDGWKGMSQGFQRNANRFQLDGRWRGAWILFAALSLALWFPVVVWLLAIQEWALAAVFGIFPFVLLQRWYRGWFSVLLAPLAMVAILPVILRCTITALTGRRVQWKGRIV